MTRDERALWAVACVASLLFHGVLVLQFGTNRGEEDSAEARHQVTRLSFRSLAASEPVPAEPLKSGPDVPEARPEPADSPPPEPLKRPPREAHKPSPKPKSDSRAVAEQAPPSEPEVPSSMPVDSKEKHPPGETTVASAPDTSDSVVDPALVERDRERYLRLLMAHIESHKHYPRAARRRRIEGDVHVTFTLGGGGGVGAVSTEGAHRLLLDAASRALESAQPLPPPPATLSLPREVSFTMRYRLR